MSNHENVEKKPWIRGVNLGGWLVLERFITPYFFAITDCTLRGDFHFYPNQIDAPPSTSPLYKVMDEAAREKCNPVLPYPTEEWTLTQAFGSNKELARDYMRLHWDHFLKRDDITRLKHEGGVTHVRVPLGHWIMGDILDDEPWVDGEWEYFERLVGWCREEGIEIWPDLHTAPGSQNGFDNSGLLLDEPTCHGWDADFGDRKEWDEQHLSDNFNLSTNVLRTLKAVDDITKAIGEGNMTDVVTGFGVLNEPFVDCDPLVIRKFDQLAFNAVRKNMGKDTVVYIGDMFNSTKWQGWWTDKEYQNTFLDSHYYHVFAERPRGLSPRQHIAYVCQHNHRDTVACCYDDEDKKEPSQAISRIIGEWSASFDTLVCDKLDIVMAGIAVNGTAAEFDREIEPERKAFLRNFVEAQMVTYESADVGVSRGWFYWNFKMEGGAFTEWDFLRGIKDGWMPPIPAPDVSSVDLYGSCYDILLKTNDDDSIIHEFPDPSSLDPNNWQGVLINDDVVVSHGQSLWNDANEESITPLLSMARNDGSTSLGLKKGNTFTVITMILFGAYFAFLLKRTRKKGYVEVSDSYKENGKIMEITV